MRITKRQEEEIDFLCKYWGGSREDTEEYINATVKGIRTTTDKLSGNSLRVAKTKLDRNIKMWREGLGKWTWKQELLDDFNNHPQIVKILRSL